MSQDPKQKVRSQFAKNAEKYVTSESHAKGADLTLLIEWLNPESHWTALDIATGGGHVAKALSPFVEHVFATDLTKEMLANTAKHLNQSYQNIWYVIADAESLPFLDRTFDIVTCRIAPHHFPNPERFIKEVARVLKPNGSFLMIDNVVPEERNLAEFMNEMEKLRDESHVKCLSIEEWRKQFADAGLLETRSRSRKKPYQFQDWVKRTATSSGQIEKVEEYILSASKEIHTYFNVTSANEKVETVQIDEWMVLCQKEG
ncbi:methyltransferase family protein [Scopulibacillus darangshiensis]|uniref:Methyltransferase family protein n=1 Tax=Scopulibacillus darangshiensis TaxID=442528 RepID=A0A4R2P5S9_9BACL|nr:class I SAM-dependent methyltransferase [Scopulibacillus darangshiensis]TCP30219.1 methyltransferase family protein [Scopulibacillus darangshiensis]